MTPRLLMRTAAARSAAACMVAAAVVGAPTLALATEEPVDPVVSVTEPAPTGEPTSDVPLTPTPTEVPTPVDTAGDEEPSDAPTSEDATPGPTPGTSAPTQPDTTPGTPANPTPGTPAEPAPGATPDTSAPTQPDTTPGTPANPTPGTPADPAEPAPPREPASVDVTAKVLGVEDPTPDAGASTATPSPLPPTPSLLPPTQLPSLMPGEEVRPCDALGETIDQELCRASQKVAASTQGPEPVILQAPSADSPTSADGAQFVRTSPWKVLRSIVLVTMTPPDTDGGQSPEKLTVRLASAPGTPGARDVTFDVVMPEEARAPGRKITLQVDIPTDLGDLRPQTIDVALAASGSGLETAAGRPGPGSLSPWARAASLALLDVQLTEESSAEDPAVPPQLTDPELPHVGDPEDGRTSDRDTTEGESPRDDAADEDAPTGTDHSFEGILRADPTRPEARATVVNRAPAVPSSTDGTSAFAPRPEMSTPGTAPTSPLAPRATLPGEGASPLEGGQVAPTPTESPLLDATMFGPAALPPDTVKLLQAAGVALAILGSFALITVEERRRAR